MSIRINRGPLDLDDQFLADVITTAIEGGIGYWSETVVYKWTEGPEHTHAEIIADDVHYKITPRVIATGIEKILTMSFKDVPALPNWDWTIRNYIVNAVGDIPCDGGWIDSDAADTIVQVGLFNEIVYG